MKLATAAEMQRLDRTAIEDYGVPGIVLMENAGHGTFMGMEEYLGPCRERTVVLFIGPGNNGGDGLVIARRIHMAGGFPLLFFAGPPERLKNDAATNYAIVQKLGLTQFVLSEPLDSKKIREAILHRHGKHPVHSLVDALFGTGLAREITGHMAGVVSLLNELRREYGWPVVAVDLPSGIDADTCGILGTAVQADLTVTYGLAKPAHYMDGGGRIGRLRIVDIGIPEAAVNKASLQGSVLTDDIRQALPLRLPDSHKGTHGHLLVLAGSAGKTGAAILSCRAALRSGCGLVSAAVPCELNPVFEQSLIEAMTIPLPNSKFSLSLADVDSILNNAMDKTAVALGPGIGMDSETVSLVLQLYETLSLPMVIDADALNILALHPHILAQPGGPRILTPHPGEMSRLTGLTTREIQRNRIKTALSLCTECDQEIITVLKGAGTVIARNNEEWTINSTGNQGMASGGMGDVLTGLIGGLLARKLAPWDAARVGVYLHGLAADRLAAKAKYGYLASEVITMIPMVINQVKSEPMMHL